MAYVTDDDSKATRRITEIERELQATIGELEQRLAARSALTSVAEMVAKERETKSLTDRIQALVTALELQRALASPNCTSRNGISEERRRGR